MIVGFTALELKTAIFIKFMILLMLFFKGKFHLSEESLRLLSGNILCPHRA